MNRRWVAYPLLAFVTLLVFVGAFDNQFVTWDDELNIYANPNYLPPTSQSLVSFWSNWDRPYGLLYIPTVYTAWWILARISGSAPDAAVFHSAVVLLHVANVLLVFGLIRKLLAHAARDELVSSAGTQHAGAARNTRRPSAGTDGTLYAAAAGALLFALHPLQVEPVAWASGMKDVLFGFTALIALRLYIEMAIRPTAASGRDNSKPWVDTRMWFIAPLFAAFAFLSLLAKPTAVVVPAIAGVIDCLILRRPLRKVLWWLLPWVLLAIPVVLEARHGQPFSGLVNTRIETRPLIAADAITFYLYKLILPINLAIDYGRQPQRVLLSPLVWLTAAVPLILAGLLWLARQRYRWLVVGVLVFVLGVAPVLGLVSFEFQYFSTVADRYVYVSMLGPAMAIAWMVTRLTSARRWMIAIVVALLAVLSFLQVRHWQDNFTLFRRAIAIHPSSFAAHDGLGLALARSGDYVQAEKHFRTAIELDPKLKIAHIHLASVLALTGQIDAYIQQIDDLLRLNQTLPEAHRTPRDQILREAAGVLLSHRRYEQAALRYTELLRTHPTDAEGIAGQTIAQAAAQLQRTGNPSQFTAATAHLFSTGRYAASDLHRMLGTVLLNEQHPKDAIAHFAAILQRNPNDPDARQKLQQATPPPPR